MAKEVTKKESTDIVNWEEKLAAEANADAKAERPQASFISLKSGILSMGGVPVPENKLKVCIIAAAHELNYYTEKYDPNNLRSPKCFALDVSGDEEAIQPHNKSEDKQNEFCHDCRHMKWRSDLWGGKGKACQERRRLLLLPVDALENADSVLAAEVAIMKLPVTSVKFWSQYVNLLSGIHKRPAYAMITEIGTEPDAKNQFRVVFKPVAEVDLTLLTAINQKVGLSEEILLKPYDPNTDEEKAEPKKDAKYA